MADFKINGKNVVTQSGIAEPALASNVTGGGGLTSLGTITAGTLGSAVTFPAGMVRQIKYGDMGAVATGDTDVYLPNTLQFSSAILASSDVMLFASGCGAMRNGHNDNNIDMWFSSADGGSLGAGTSGFRFLQDFEAYTAHVHRHTSFSGQYLVTNPGSTTPTYKLYLERVSGQNYEIHFVHLTLMEITG